MKILVVDDEELLVKGIRFNLQNDGYQVVTGSNGREAIELARDPDIRLIVLDVMMPEIDGLTACRTIREFSDVPIIMLTARTEDMDKLLGFEHGADDYLTKPFNILELKARIRALLRRSGGLENQNNRITAGSLTVDTQERNVYKDGKPVELTAREFDLVELLIRNPNRVYSRENLLDLIWGYEYRSDIRTVDVHIRRLREKIEKNPGQPEYIFTETGIGYLARLDGGIRLVLRPFVELTLHGAGDVFTSALCGELLCGKAPMDALDSAADFCDRCIHETVKRQPWHWYGLAFEPVLKGNHV